MTIPPKFALFECANMGYLIRDVENEKFLNRYEEVELLNDLSAENKYLLDMLSSMYNKPRTSFSLIHKMKKLEEENWRLKKILALGGKMNIVTFILLIYIIIVGLVCLLGLFLDKGWI